MTRNRRMTQVLTLAVAAGSAFSQGELLDLERVTLYRSGVASFEWRGEVEGDTDIALRFGRDQINDILKSLVLLDMDGGRIEAVGYDSKEPLERRLSGFAIDVRRAASLYGLLDQVRGTPVRLDLAEGPVEGTVIGLENRPVVVDEQTINVGFVNLLTSNGVRSIDLSQARDVRLLDERLAGELSAALAALAGVRGDDAATVDLRFRGDGSRGVAVAYVHEAPVWKASYRLVLPEDGPSGSGTLQGWAIVENTTDADWTDVGLTLVSGRPVGFTMDLYEPLYLPRPEIAVPVETAAAPKLFEAGQRVERARVAGRPSPAAMMEDGESAFGRGNGAFSADAIASMAPEAMASAREAGELFTYELNDPVTIERRRSAMIPILTSEVATRRVSIYNESDLAAHPMRGVEVTNDSGLKLMPGPVTVFDGSAYAGDAQIGSAGDGQARLLAYAVDLDVAVQTERRSSMQTTAVSIRGGAIRRTRSQVQTVEYAIENRDTRRDRVVIVEVPRLGGWELDGDVKPSETTDSAYRFEVGVDPGETGALRVDQRRVWSDSVALAPQRFDVLVRELRGERASRQIIEAIERAAELQDRVRLAEERLAQLDAERGRIGTEQGRIRSNMGSVGRDSDLYRRYLRTLEAQEDRLESLRDERSEAEALLEARRAELRSYLDGLRIG